MITLDIPFNYLKEPHFRINESNIFEYAIADVEEVVFDQIDLFNKEGCFIKTESIEKSRSIVKNKEFCLSRFNKTKILFNYQCYNVFNKGNLSNIQELNDFKIKLEELFEQRIFMIDTNSLLKSFDFLNGDCEYGYWQPIGKISDFIDSIKFLYCPILVGARQTLFHRVKKEQVLNFDYKSIDLFVDNLEMNKFIKFFTSVFWMSSEKEMLDKNFDKNSALMKRFMKNINNDIKEYQFQR